MKTNHTVWKTLKRPARASAAYYRARFQEKGISIGDYANQILDKIDFAEGPDEIDIARVFVRTLGFLRATRRGVVYDKAIGQGLLNLPAWSAVELRDNYHEEQPLGEWLIAGMEPIADADGYPRLLDVERFVGGSLWLNSYWGHADDKWSPGFEFLFAIPRKFLSLNSLDLEHLDTLPLELIINNIKYRKA